MMRELWIRGVIIVLLKDYINAIILGKIIDYLTVLIKADSKYNSYNNESN